MPAPLEHILNEVWVFLFVCLFAFLNYVKAYRMVQGSIIPLINEQKAWKSYPSLLNSQAEPQRCTFFFFFSFSPSFSVWLDQLSLPLLNTWLACLKGSALFLWFLLSQYLLKLLLQVCTSVSYFTIFCLLNNSASNDRYGISPPDPQEL